MGIATSFTKFKQSWSVSLMGRQLRLEYYVIAVFLLFSSFFLKEVYHFGVSGKWILHAGENGFHRWPQLSAHSTVLLLHSIGMLTWVGVVVYQLHTRGRGAHTWVGRSGFVLLLVSLAFAWRPARVTSVPAIHTFLSLTLMQVTLVVNFLGVVVETFVGILKARDKRVSEHRQHLMAAVMFSAAPGLYRAIFEIVSWGNGCISPESRSEFQTVRLHEISACLAIMMGVMSLFSKTFGGHLVVLTGKKTKRGRDKWQSVVAKVVLAFGVLTLGLYSFWLIDLLLMKSGGSAFR